MRTERKQPAERVIHKAGTRFGKLTITAFSGFSTEDGYAYLCRCDCGLKHIRIPASRLFVGCCNTAGCRPEKAKRTLNFRVYPERGSGGVGFPNAYQCPRLFSLLLSEQGWSTRFVSAPLS